VCASEGAFDHLLANPWVWRSVNTDDEAVCRQIITGALQASNVSLGVEGGRAAPCQSARQRLVGAASKGGTRSGDGELAVALNSRP
jgi:hypothetical protein